MINSFLADDHRDWDLHLNELRFALNSAVHSLGVSPAFLNLGRNPVPSTLLRNYLENQIALHDLVRRHMDKAVARQVRHYNKNRREAPKSCFIVRRGQIGG